MRETRVVERLDRETVRESYQLARGCSRWPDFHGRTSRITDVTLRIYGGGDTIIHLYRGDITRDEMAVGGYVAWKLGRVAWERAAAMRAETPELRRECLAEARHHLHTLAKERPTLVLP